MARRKLTKEILNEEFKLLGIEFLNYDGANKPVKIKLQDGSIKEFTRATKAIEKYKLQIPLNEDSSIDKLREKIILYRVEKFRTAIVSFKDIKNRYGNNVIDVKEFAHHYKIKLLNASSILDNYAREGKLIKYYELKNNIFTLNYKIV